MLSETLNHYDFENKSYASFPVELEEPRICNHCDHTGQQIFVSGIALSKSLEKTDAICFFNCYFCQKTSIHFMSFVERNSYTWLKTVEVLPKSQMIERPITKNAEMIKKFPEFFEIYNQSQKAQDSELNQIAGMGFRKSLEFLVTDFLLAYPPKNVTEEWLKDPKTSLSNKIEKLENQRIKKISKAISFIGNDETHYTRRHPEHDVESIKTFIRALLSDVENEMTLLEVEKLLSKPK